MPAARRAKQMYQAWNQLQTSNYKSFTLSRTIVRAIASRYQLSHRPLSLHIPDTSLHAPSL